jgi:hypothetical protein
MMRPVAANAARLDLDIFNQNESCCLGAWRAPPDGRGQVTSAASRLRLAPSCFTSFAYKRANLVHVPDMRNHSLPEQHRLVAGAANDLFGM